MNITPDTALAEFFESTFQPSRLAGADERYAATFPRAIEWLCMALGKDEPTIADLNAVNIRRAMRTVADRGNKRHWIQKMGNRLSSLWKFAWEVGIVEHYERVPMIDLGGHNAYLEKHPEEGTVIEFYTRKYRPKLNDQVCRDTNAAIKNLDRFKGRYVTLEEVTDELLDDFGQWLEEGDMSEGRIARYQSAIRGIARAWDSSRFPRRPHHAREPLPDAASGSLREFFEQVYLPQQLLDASSGHVQQAHLAMRRLYRHYGRDILLTELTDALAADHLSWLRRDQELEPVSINTNHRSVIFATWRHAHRQGLVDKLPMVPKLKENVHEPDSWTEDELRALVKACSIFEGRAWFGCVPLDKYWRAVFLVGRYSALRVNSLFSIRQGDVNLDKRTVYARPETMKNRHGQRFGIGTDAVAAVRAIWHPRRTLLFEWPYRKEQLWAHFRRIQQAAGLPESVLSKSRFHKLRRSTATAVAAKAGIAQAASLLGHSSEEITRRYLDPTHMPHADATEFLEPLIDDGELLDLDVSDVGLGPNPNDVGEEELPGHADGA